MATNKLSSIPVVKSVDVRDINNAFNAVRECVRVLNEAVSAVNAQANQTTFNASQGSTSTAALQGQLAALQAQVNALSAAGVGPTATYRADAVIVRFDVVYPTSSGGVSPVDTQDSAAIFAAVGIATADAAIGSPIVVQQAGVINTAGAGFERGRAVYAQSGNGLTQYPNYADVAIPVGVAIASDAVNVRTAWPALQTVPMYAGYENFMPVAFGLIRRALELVESVFDQPDGLVVKVGDQLYTRAITTSSGSGIDIADGDGIFGDPRIELVSP
jgi:hypothetical protein